MWRKWIHLERILKLRKIKITRGINPKKEKKITINHEKRSFL